MNRLTVIFSIVLSLVLIVGALVIRMTGSDTSNPGIIAVKSEDNLSSEDFFKDFSQSATSSEKLTEKLTEVDYISRQMFSDYLQLKSTNQITKENLSTLAEQYADGLLEKNNHTPTVTQGQIKIMADTDTNLQNYGQKIAALIAKHGAATGLSKYGGVYSDVFSDDFIKLMVIISFQYRMAADELLSLEVPTSLAGNHLTLINNYLQSSKRFNSIAMIGADPVSALSAMNEQSKNSQTEEGLIANIKIRLMSKGLTHNL